MSWFDRLKVDFHWSVPGKLRDHPYGDDMADVYNTSLQGLKDAQEKGYKYVLLTHGSSTSRPGQTTSRSIVRGLMRSKESTPYIVKKD